MTLDLIFTIVNVFVLPFWTLMILLPNWDITRKIMSSYIPFALLAVVYLYLLSNLINAESAQALSNPKLADIARLFGEEKAVVTGWIHFLVMDLFVGRWIYWEGQRTKIFTIHSLAFCFFAGPFGLLSHIITSWVTQTFFPNSLAELPNNVSSQSV